MIQPAYYWRQNKAWSQWLGKVGMVVSATMIRVSDDSRSNLTPYSYAIVDFDGEKHEFMGETNVELQIGDKVECVLRKMAIAEKSGLVEYGIKIKLQKPEARSQKHEKVKS